MRQRVINYLNYLDEICSKEMSDDEKEVFLKGFLIQLDFYQHERLIHLLVTVTFAIISIFSMIALPFLHNIAFAVFTVGMLIMLIFYVRHYFFLERSVQKMYTYYDKLKEPRIFTDNIIEPFRQNNTNQEAL